MNVVIREDYLSHIRRYLSKGFIHILTGQRRVGKSVLLQLFRQDYNSSLVIDMELYDNRRYTDPDLLYSYLSEQVRAGVRLVCIDEIQDIIGWERVLISLQKTSPQVQWLITGSNSTMLSSELTTHLRGRYTQTHIFPFGYTEFCQYFALGPGYESFRRYLTTGSLPSVYQFEREDQQVDRTKTLCDTILLRDIIERYAIREPHLLKELFYFVLENTGSITNTQNIRNALKQKGIKMTNVTIQNYLGHLMDSYLIYGVDVYDTQGKKVFDRMRKYYPSDHMWRDRLLGDFDPGMGKKLETIVYFELMRKGWTVYVGRLKDREIDFVGMRNGEKVYIQVAYRLDREETIEREYASLRKINDNHPKYIISIDDISLGHRDGIYHMPIWDWIMTVS